MSGQSQRDTVETDVNVDIDTEPPSLVAAARSYSLMYLLGIAMAVLAIVGYTYNLTAGITDVILFSFLAITFLVVAIARTLHLNRGG